jgi:DedD protein
MGLFSFLRKNKQTSAPEDKKFYSRAEEDSNAVRARRSRRKQAEIPEEEPVDPVLPEKKRARRRLVGAIALVLAAIIGLPMILDSEPKPLASDIAIQIPSKDKLQAAEGATQSHSKAAASSALDHQEEMVEPPANAAAPARQDGVAPATSTGKAKEEAKPEAGKPAKSENRTQARMETKGASKAEESEGDSVVDRKANKFTVQVAAFATPEKVNELRNKLKSAGITSYTQRVATESGEKIRVRIGPFTSKEEADKMRAKLAKLGLNGTLVPT